MMRAIVACMLACVLSCSLLAQSTPSQVTLWLFRPNADNLSSAGSLYVDGRKLVNLGHGQFFGIHVSPGLHAFNWTNQPGARQVVVPVGADPQAYLEVTFISSSPFLSINPLSADQAITAMSGISPIDQNGIFDSGVIVPPHAIQAAVKAQNADLATNAKPAAVSVSARNAKPNRRSKAEKETIWVTAVTQESNVVTSVSTYQTPRTAKTSCGGTAITVPLTTGNVNCDTPYDPPRRHNIGFRIDVMNKVRAEDGQVYTIACSAHWLGSNCAELIDGDSFKAEVEKPTMWITVNKNQGQQVHIKYKILDIQ
jgi:hypothetical protein